MRRLTVLLIMAMVVVVITGSSIANGFGQAPKVSAAQNVEEVQKLPTIETPDKLKELVLQAYQNQNRNSQGLAEGLTKGIGLVDGTAKRAAQSSVDTGVSLDSLSYSATNVQVAGVDEADIVKTDGKYIYHVVPQQVVVTEAYPVDQMKIVSRISFDDHGFRPQELYLHGHYLVIIGTSEITADTVRKSVVRDVVSKALVYDITDKSSPTMVREVELNGHYLSSRIIGSALYLVVNKEVPYYWIQNPKEEVPTPFYRDSVRSGLVVNIDCENIRYFPELVEPNYLVIGALDLDKPDQEMQVATYLGGGQTVYASLDNLYVAYTTYGPVTVKDAEAEPATAPETPPTAPQRLFDIIGQDAQQAQLDTKQPAHGANTKQPVQDVMMLMPQATKTVIYKFKLNQGQISYVGNGEVPGAVLNQFSMDEHNGFFRVATTSNIFPTENHKNSVYVLNEKLSLVGKLEGVAPGERIYSVRFMGDRGYVVTFKKVDPLFVLDLHEPSSPKILGQLKIPGYSDYLHPYDENHIIGFGKDTISSGSMAFYQGMKIALFDVSDVEHPRELFKEVIGDRGTDSELLRNHKALLFDKEKGLLAFPVMVAEIKSKNISTAGTVPYGEPVFQGAYVYHLDLTNGFQLKTKITHMPNPQMQGRSMYDKPEQWVDRILYIGDTLYTLSKGMIKANSMTDYRETGSLVISYQG